MRHTWFPDRYGMVLVITGAPKAFFDQLKDLVPEAERRYEHNRRGWWISDGWIYEVHQLISEHTAA